MKNMMKLKRLIMFLSLIIYTSASCASTEKTEADDDNNLSNNPISANQAVLMSHQAVDAVGLNTHLNYMNTIYNTKYEEIIKPSLIDLGVKHIRDHLGNETVNKRYIDLAHNHGIKLLVINDDNGRNLDRNFQEIRRLNRVNPSEKVIEMIEPANETDYGWDMEWESICEYLKKFHKTYKNDTETSNIPLLGLSFADTKSSAVTFSKYCQEASSLIDIGNLHAYSGLYPESSYSGGWGISLKQAIENYHKLVGDKPIIETENGFKNSKGVDGHPAVSQYVAAKFLPRLILSRLKQGVSRVYIYQLINDNWENFGLLNNDGSPRLQYSSLKNFISLMSDQGKDFITEELDYKLEGNLTNIQQILFQKRDGTYMLMLWQGINSTKGGYNDDDYEDFLPANEIELILNLNKNVKSINVYRPSFNRLPDGNGTKPVDTKNNINNIKLSVPDHLVIVEIKN